MSKTERRPCRFDGCVELTTGSTGFCRVHHRIAHKCAIDDCPNRVAAHSRSRCCTYHHNEGVRLLRKAFRPWDS